MLARAGLKVFAAILLMSVVTPLRAQWDEDSVMGHIQQVQEEIKQEREAAQEQPRYKTDPYHDPYSDLGHIQEVQQSIGQKDDGYSDLQGSSSGRDYSEKTKQLMAGHRYPPLRGPKKTIAVLTFENRAKGSAGSAVVGEGLTEMLTTELFKTGHFIIVERNAIQSVAREQELGQTGMVRQGKAARVGELLGAEFLIKGVVSEFQYKTGEQGFGIGFKGLNLGSKKASAHVGIDVRIIDSSSGAIEHAYNARAVAEASGFNIGFEEQGGDWKIGTGSFNKTPMGVATREAMYKAILFILDKSASIPWSGSVVKVSGTKVYINRGSNSDLSAGMQMSVYSKGEALIDPETGINLGAEEEMLGTLHITTVKEKFSIGRLKQAPGAPPCKRGDVVRIK